jgi:tRNA threonylcarbamoyladenosine biosynthesis protein TsaB
MSMILHIDTAIDTAYISIAKDGEVITSSFNKEQKEHGAFLHTGIKALLNDAAVSIQQLEAVAISAGPGSYTGLRVGMATAKGLCYALKKPLISIGTLEILAFGVIMDTDKGEAGSAELFCPMIDARRMEVFTALYNKFLQPILPPCAIIIDEKSFVNYLLNNKIYYFGNGLKKWESISWHKNAVFVDPGNNVLSMSKLAYKKFQYNDFADLAYSEPLYIKDFFNHSASV